MGLSNKGNWKNVHDLKLLLPFYKEKHFLHWRN